MGTGPRGRGSPRSPPHAAPCVPSERRFACAVEEESGGARARGRGGRRGREEGGNESARGRGGGGGESRCRVRFRDARRNAPLGRDSGAPGAPRAGTHRLLLSARARALACSSNFRRRRFVSATCWRRARARASIIVPPLGPADVGERSARAVARRSNAAHRRAREVQDQRRRPCRCGGRVLLRPPPASLVTGRSLRVHAAARCAPAPANRARPRPPAARVNH